MFKESIGGDLSPIFDPTRMKMTLTSKQSLPRLKTTQTQNFPQFPKMLGTLNQEHSNQ